MNTKNEKRKTYVKHSRQTVWRLDGARRGMMMLFATLLLTMTAQTARAVTTLTNHDGDLELGAGEYVVSGNVTIKGNIFFKGNATLTVEGTLTLDSDYNGSIAEDGGALTLIVHNSGSINAYYVNAATLNMDGGSITCYNMSFRSGVVSGGTINAAYNIQAAGTISGGTFTAMHQFIAGNSSNLTITGGTINASDITSSIYIFYDTTINADDPYFNITAPFYAYDANLFISNRDLIDGDGTVYAASANLVNPEDFAGKTLRPAYTVTFDENGGSDVDNKTVAGGSTISAPVSNRDGYTLTGWYNGSDAYNFTTKVTSDLTLTAHWSENIATLYDDGSKGALEELTAMSGKQTKVNFERTGLTVGKYSTICLPYDFTVPSGCTFYKFDGVKKEGDDWVADISTTTGGSANTPYIFTTETAASVTFSNDAVVAAASYSDATANTSVTDWTFQGTYSQIDLPNASEHDYGFAAGDGSTVAIGTFVHLVSGASAAPFRAYLKYTGTDTNWALTRSDGDTLPSRIIVRVVDSYGDKTAIGTLDTRTGEISTGDWYSLDGRRLQGKPSTKGIYIHSGRKEVLK